MSNNRYELFFDSETLSENSIDATVVDVSCLIIDKEKMISDKPYTMRNIIEVQYFKLDTDQQMNDFNTKSSKHTMDFWSKQTQEIRNRIKPSDKDINVSTFIKKFNSYIGSEPALSKFWCRNTSFDFINLKRLYSYDGKNIDDYIKHYQIRDIRTCLDTSFEFAEDANLNFCPVKDEDFWNKVFQQHNSTWDVIADVLRYQAILRANKGMEQINR